jgi:hypothetical protein
MSYVGAGICARIILAVGARSRRVNDEHACTQAACLSVSRRCCCARERWHTSATSQRFSAVHACTQIEYLRGGRLVSCGRRWRRSNENRRRSIAAVLAVRDSDHVVAVTARRHHAALELSVSEQAEAQVASESAQWLTGAL